MSRLPCLAEFSLSEVEEASGGQQGSLQASVLQAMKPLVLRGYCRDWPAVQECSKSPGQAASYLCKFYNGSPVSTAYGGPEVDGRVFYNDAIDGFNFRSQLQDLRKLLQNILECADDANPPTLYMPSTDVTRWFPGFAEQNSAGLGELSPIGFLWLGNRTRIAAHYDFPSNLACNIAGRRRFTLFPPEQVANLYPGPLGFAPGGQEISMVDFRQPDFKKFPKFEEALASAQTVTLNPGDALLIPGMWWHHVEGLETLNVLYSHWWRDLPTYTGSPSSALLHTMLSLGGLSPELRRAWKALFEHYIFDESSEWSAQLPESARGYTRKPVSESAAMALRAELVKRLG